MTRPIHSSALLAVAYAALIVYASLYPFDWHHPQGLWSLALLNLPWPRWWGGFDVVANLLGYMPLGALVFAAAMHPGRNRWAAVAVAVVLSSLLSLAMELTQNDLPTRAPSALDWALNSAGAGLGALLAALIDATGLPHRWRSIRERWLVAGSASATALLVLWPVGLLFPMPVPLALGQVWPHVADAAAALGAWAEGVPWAASWAAALAQVDLAPSPLSLLAEATLTAFGLLAPCMLVFTVTRPGWRRVALVLGAATLGLTATTLSTALNFGPQHALAWLTPSTLPAFGVAILVASAVAGVSRRTAAALGLVVVTALLALSAQAPADPYFAESLQAWEQGRFIRFHGLAQWVGWLWPFALLVHLLSRAGARVEGRL